MKVSVQKFLYFKYIPKLFHRKYNDNTFTMISQKLVWDENFNENFSLG